MAQDVEGETEATEAATATEDLTAPTETLAPESEGQELPKQPDAEQKPEEAQPEFDPESEQVIEFAGKTYTLKGKELQAILESQNALTEREKALNRDYTHKSQALARERKSIESAFGMMPSPEEFQALGKLYQSYLSDPNIAGVIDAILNGEPLDSVLGQSPNQNKNSQSPEVSSLQREIQSLKSQLSQFVSGSEREKQEAAYNEGERLFNSWQQAKKASGVTIPEEIIDSIIETATILKRRNPSWDTNKALDEALRRETIDEIQKTVTKTVLAKADQAKKTSAIKITPKSAQRSEKDMGYSEIFMNAM